MEEKEILSISLASLLKVIPLQTSDLAFDGCVMGHRETLESESVMDLFRFPTRINAFGVVFCSKGLLKVSFGLRHCAIGPQTMFVCPSGTIIQVEAQSKAAVHFILCEEEFINKMHIDVKLLLHLFMAVRENPCLGMSDTEWAEVMRSMEEIYVEGSFNRSDVLSVEILNTLFRTLAYRICRIIDDQLGKRSESETEGASFDRNALYFKLFIEELSKNYMQERSVGFYAERLHLTPKYLTTLLRTTTGRTASEWIDEYVVLESKNLLKYSTMNIQEIAYYLNFPNQSSFFGRYFKQHTGMSPTAYRSSK